MKLYRCTKYDNALGTLLSWHPNRRDAKAELRRHQLERGDTACGPECVESVDVPTDKAGLLTWLNRNLHADNG